MYAGLKASTTHAVTPPLSLFGRGLRTLRSRAVLLAYYSCPRELSSMKFLHRHQPSRWGNVRSCRKTRLKKGAFLYVEEYVPAARPTSPLSALTAINNVNHPWPNIQTGQTNCPNR